jgi:guanosine-3',5'-bis(diphosphate) 3'-pyrophosphohydrolase
MPLRTELKDGDRVEIVTAPHAHPNPAWLSYVSTGKAKAQIRQFLKTRQDREAAVMGERLLERALDEIGHELGEVDDMAWDRFLRDTGARNRTEIFADIGLGVRLGAVVARRLMARDDNLQSEVRNAGSVVIHGTEGAAVHLAECCSPIPGDPIVGLIRKGQGLVIHTHDCSALGKLRGSKAEWVDVEWEADLDRLFDVHIRVITRNHLGVLAKLATGIADMESNITNISMQDDDDNTTSIYFTLQVTDRSHLARVLRVLRRVPSVIRIYRHAEQRK